MEPRYLGDGVYASVKHGMVMLTTGHHLEEQAEKVIWLEPDVIKALHTYLAQTIKEYKL